MISIIIEGRGGQGAQTAGNVLASAFFAEGLEVQSFATYGGARRGTPVSSTIRIDDRPIRVRSNIDKADAILCFDASLLEARLYSSARPDTLVLVNSARPSADFKSAFPGYRVLAIDAIAVARRFGLGRIVNSVLLGALARALEAPPLEVLERAILDETGSLQSANRAACAEGYRSVDLELRAPPS